MILHTYITISDANDFIYLMDTIEEFGKGLCGIVLLLNDYLNGLIWHLISAVGPELKTLTVGSNSLDDPYKCIYIDEEDLEELSKRCKKLKDLKIIEAFLYPDENEIKKMFPNCNVEIIECKFQCKRCDYFDHGCDCGESDSSSESAHDADEINDILTISDEGENEEEENGNEKNRKQFLSCCYT